MITHTRVCLPRERAYNSNKDLLKKYRIKFWRNEFFCGLERV